tara:strand:- start:470 stop:1018 length:549 start_codon:yes stop_codon:yes gene_type:complete
LLSTTIHSYIFGSNLNPKIKKVFHPLVFTMAMTQFSCFLMAKLSPSSLGYGTISDVLRIYTTKSMTPLSFGAGDVLLFFLGPAVIALSLQMFARRELMKKFLVQCVCGCLGSSLFSIFSTAWACNLLNVKTEAVRLSTLSRSITSPLAIAMTGERASFEERFLRCGNYLGCGGGETDRYIHH